MALEVPPRRHVIAAVSPVAEPERASQSDSIEYERTGTLRNGGRPSKLTVAKQRKGRETQRRRKALNALTLEEKGWKGIEMALDALLAQAARQGDAVQLDLLREMRAAGETALNRTLGTPVKRLEARSLHVNANLDELRDELKRLSDDELYEIAYSDPPELPPAAA